MALTSYCKKCDKDVPVGEICPYCGGKLTAASVRTAWCRERIPVKDWICWNGVMRFVLPGALGILIIIVLAELISGGPGALERMIGTGLLTILLVILGAILLVAFLALLLQGKDLQDTVADGKGIRVTTWLPEPTALKLFVRMKPASLLEKTRTEGQTPVLELDTTEIAWKNITRVQLWPEKCMILFYAPKMWLRLSITCTPFTWEDCLTLIREKIGKKKNVDLPPILQVRTEKKTTRHAKPGAVLIPEVEEALEQLTMEDMMGVPVPPEPEKMEENNETI